MKKFGLSLALLAGLSFAVVTAMPTPAEAQKSGKSSKKSKKGKAAKVTVQKASSPVSVTYFHNCVSYWGWLAPVGAVGCGAVWAVPTIVESIFWRA
jgi:hypothetical protein